MIYIGTHWVKFYPESGLWVEDERYTQTDRFKELLPEFKSLITRALESSNPKEWIKAQDKRLKEIGEQYRIDSEILIKE